MAGQRAFGRVEGVGSRGDVGSLRGRLSQEHGASGSSDTLWRLETHLMR